MDDLEKGNFKADSHMVKAKQANARPWDHPADKFWSTYLEDAEKFDKRLLENLKGDTDGILIFTGLFAAVVASFTVESCSMLQPDPNEASVALLTQLVALSSSSNASQAQSASTQQPFTAPQNAVRVNALFFTSLVLALACALSATLAQQWARRYHHLVSRRGPPHVRGPLRMFLFEGLARFRFTHVLGCVLALLHASVFVFVGGLVEYVDMMNSTVSNVVLVLAVSGLAVYALLSVAPLFAADCPYGTPLTGVLRFIFAVACCLTSSASRLFWTCMGATHPLVSMRTFLSTAVSSDHGWAPALRQRAARISVGGLRRAVRTTLRNVDEEHELEAFLDSLPGLLNSLSEGAVAVAAHLVHEEAVLARALQLVAKPNPGARTVRICTATIRALTRRVLGPGAPPAPVGQAGVPLSNTLWQIIDRMGALLQSSQGLSTLHAACTLGALTADLLDGLERRVETGSLSMLAPADTTAMFAALFSSEMPSGKAAPDSSPSIGAGLWVAVEGTQLNLRADGYLRALLQLVRRVSPLLGPDTPQADVDVLLEVLGRLHPTRTASIPLVQELRDELDTLGALCRRRRQTAEGEALRRVHLALLRSAAGLPGVLGSSVVVIRWKEGEEYGMPM